MHLFQNACFLLFISAISLLLLVNLTPTDALAIPPRDPLLLDSASARVFLPRRGGEGGGGGGHGGVSGGEGSSSGEGESSSSEGSSSGKLSGSTAGFGCSSLGTFMRKQPSALVFLAVVVVAIVISAVYDSLEKDPHREISTLETSETL